MAARLRHAQLLPGISSVPDASGMPRRWCFWLAALSLAGLVVLSGCGGDADPPSSPGDRTSTGAVPTATPTMGESSPAPSRDVTGSPDSSPTDPLSGYRERCLGETRSLDEAEVRFEKEVRLETGDHTQFSVTLQRPDLLPSASGTPSQGRVHVACIIEARLVSPDSGVSISPEDWVTDRYVPPTPTTWTWLVTATDPAEAIALLQLRPAILVDDGVSPVKKADLGVVDFPVTFHVTRSASDTAGVAWRWIVGAVGLVVALLAIPPGYQALRGRKRDSTSVTTASGNDDQPEMARARQWKRRTRHPRKDRS